METARVLELGCGDGGNLVPMAHGLPQATFTGVDLNDGALARGRALAKNLNMTNVDLRQGDLEHLDPAALRGEFDYVIAHGVYSWVSPQARDNVLRIAGAATNDQGLVYLSYNAKPGGHLRQIVRELMQFATRYETDPHRIVQRAREAVALTAQAQQPGDVYGAFLDEYLTKVLERSDAGVLHDDLELHNHAVYVEEIAAHAERHGLRFLAEAELHESSLGNLPPQTAEALDGLEPRSELEQEQALDFLRMRMYRQTLFAKQGGDLPEARRLDSLNAYSPMRPTDDQAELADETLVEFEGRHGAKLNTDHPSVKQAFAALGARWPAPLRVADLVGDDPDAVRQALLGGHAAGLVQLTTHSPAVAHEPADRPAASAVARAQAARGDETVANLKHERIPVADDLGRRLIVLLDGTRDRAALLDTMQDEGRLDASLARLAAFALLAAPYT